MRRIRIKSEDTNFSRLIKWERNWTCERCGRKHEVGSRGLHASHFVGRAHNRLRWDRDNVDVFCYACHQYMETKKATEYRDWKIKKLGKERFNELEKKSREIRKMTKEEKKAMAQGFYQELKKYE